MINISVAAQPQSLPQQSSSNLHTRQIALKQISVKWVWFFLFIMRTNFHIWSCFPDYGIGIKHIQTLIGCFPSEPRALYSELVLRELESGGRPTVCTGGWPPAAATHGLGMGWQPTCPYTSPEAGRSQSWIQMVGHIGETQRNKFSLELYVWSLLFTSSSDYQEEENIV